MASLSAEGNVLDERQDVKRIGAPLTPWVLCIGPASTWQVNMLLCRNPLVNLCP